MSDPSTSGASATDPVTYSVAKTTPLASINTIIAQREALLGPLIAVGNDGQQTILTFDRNPPEPDPKARLVVGTALPNGSIAVAQGTVFVAGQLTAVIAVRP